jgi:predicted Rossmann-fold nucleotide-binding protein
MTGGYSGVMDAASRGARDAGGEAIGVTVPLPPGRIPSSALTRELPARDLFERLYTLTMSPIGYVVVEPSLGTLTELFLAWTLLATGARSPAPLVLLGETWTPLVETLVRGGYVDERLTALLRLARTPHEAVRALGL